MQLMRVMGGGVWLLPQKDEVPYVDGAHTWFTKTERGRCFDTYFTVHKTRPYRLCKGVPQLRPWATVC